MFTEQLPSRALSKHPTNARFFQVSSSLYHDEMGQAEANPLHALLQHLSDPFHDMLRKK